jgi:hypothetical protein
MPYIVLYPPRSTSRSSVVLAFHDEADFQPYDLESSDPEQKVHLLRSNDKYPIRSASFLLRMAGSDSRILYVNVPNPILHHYVVYITIILNCCFLFILGQVTDCKGLPGACSLPTLP